MFDFATAITDAVLAFINSFMGLVDPTTFVGGLITLSAVGMVGISLVSLVFRRLVRR